MDKINVLAVMDYASGALDGTGVPKMGDQLAEARAAVADLIHAATACGFYCKGGDNVVPVTILVLQRFDRLRAALARISP